MKKNLNLTTRLKRLTKRRQAAEDRVSEAFANVPRITNDTVAEHREEVLAGARKFIYPLQHSKHRVVRITAILFAAVLLFFFVSMGLALYKFQSTSSFVYDVTRVIPVPVAKAGNSWVSYESYLFELRRNMHYYRTQQRANFTTPDGKVQLQRLKSQAMATVIQAAYVKQLAAPKGISVSSREVADQVQLVRGQNRLGSNDRVFKDVLNEFWGWSKADFERALTQQLLQQKVASTLDTTTHARADGVLRQLQGGGDFAALAAQASDDAITKVGGGVYPQPISRNDHNVAPQLAAELFRLKPGELSSVVDTGYTLEIVKVIDATSSSLHAAHIQFTLKDITSYVKPLASKNPSHQYIKI